MYLFHSPTINKHICHWSEAVSTHQTSNGGIEWLKKQGFLSGIFVYVCGFPTTNGFSETPPTHFSNVLKRFRRSIWLKDINSSQPTKPEALFEWNMNVKNPAPWHICVINLLIISPSDCSQAYKTVLKPLTTWHVVLVFQIVECYVMFKYMFHYSLYPLPCILNRGTTNPWTTNPSRTNQLTTNPSTTNPSTANSSTTNSPTTHPPVAMTCYKTLCSPW